MPKNDAWDWPFLLYVGTALLKRSEAQFWKMTPRKLNALTTAYVKFNNPEQAEGQPASSPKTGFIDQVI